MWLCQPVIIVPFSTLNIFGIAILLISIYFKTLQAVSCEYLYPQKIFSMI